MKTRAEIVADMANNDKAPTITEVVAAVTPRIELSETDGYYAQLENEAKVIKLYNRDGLQLFGLSPELIPFQAPPLTMALQVYLMAYNQAYRTGYDDCRKKVQEVLKLCL